MRIERLHVDRSIPSGAHDLCQALGIVFVGFVEPHLQGGLDPPGIKTFDIEAGGAQPIDKPVKDRVSALRQANIYEPQRYRHLVSSIKIIGDTADGKPLDVVANFFVVRTMQDGEMTIFGAGRYFDKLKRDAGSWKFASKTVVLDSRQIDTLLAIPI